MRKIFSVSRTDKKDDVSLVTLSAMKRTTYNLKKFKNTFQVKIKNNLKGPQ